MKIGPDLYDPRDPKPRKTSATPPPVPPVPTAPPTEAPRPPGDDWGAPGPLPTEYGFSWPIDLGTWRDFNVRAEWRNDEPGGETLWLRLPWVGPIRVPFSGKIAWTLVSRSPLTVKPSIKVLFGDGVDRVHGFVTDGRWVSCVG